ncbi:MAG TPA: hypothetical protein VKA84_26485 [Gemmatimonadaceae bacterium]|nr:hypothetical protein [Gemmatimonadaceae bacterium]
MFATTLMLAYPAGCADFDAVPGTAPGLETGEVAEPSFAADVQPIFTARCALGGCHTPATRRGGLALDAAHSYDETVGVPSRLLGGAMLRVKPADPDSSWLLRLVQPDSIRRLGRSRMPLASTPLTDGQIATIGNWIRQGARRD